MAGESGGEIRGRAKGNVSFFKLFSFADWLDIVLMTAGSIGAVGNGLSQPFMTVIFGQLINAIGAYIHSKSVLHEVGKVKIFLFLLQVHCDF